MKKFSFVIGIAFLFCIGVSSCTEKPSMNCQEGAISKYFSPFPVFTDWDNIMKGQYHEKYIENMDRWDLPFPTPGAVKEYKYSFESHPEFQFPYSIRLIRISKREKLFDYMYAHFYKEGINSDSLFNKIEYELKSCDLKVIRVDSLNLKNIRTKWSSNNLHYDLTVSGETNLGFSVVVIKTAIE